MKVICVALLVLAVVGSTSAQWVKQNVDTTASFRGLSVVNEKIVWASGTGGTVIRTVDGGKTWKVITVPGAEKLDFRDIEAFDSNTAYILSIGNGDSSRIYKTTDGGETWKLQFTNKDEKAFFDAIACWDKKNCIAMSDPVDGKFVLISTSDAGENWKRIGGPGLPIAKDGEAAFAASGTCLYIGPSGTAYLITGGNDARVFRSTDRGATWIVADTPIVRGTSGSGIFSIAMFDDKSGVVVGGNYERADDRNGTFGVTSDGGERWQPGAWPNGYRSGVTFLDRRTIIAVGTNGADISYSRSLSWEPLGKENLNSVAARGRNSVWAVGPKGNVFQLDSRSLRQISESKSGEYHLVNVNAVDLSHSIIGSDCTRNEPTCSAEKIIDVRTIGVELDAPHEYAYIVSAGNVLGSGYNVRWDLSNVTPGTYKITAGIRVPIGAGYWDYVGKTITREVVVR